MEALPRVVSQREVPGASTKRIPELDGVRGLAIAMVLAYHYVNFTSHANKVLYYAFLPTQLMWSGVDLFFVLSGLLIGGILIDHRESRGYYSVFYARRIHRIFPIYYLMIALLVAGVWIFPQSPLFQGSIPYGRTRFTRKILWAISRALQSGLEWLGPSPSRSSFT